VLTDVLGFAQSNGHVVEQVMRSPLTGPKGNVEFLAYLRWPGSDIGQSNLEAMITALVPPSDSM
jgi:hypothetical protein